jgi:hypothetical protein
MLQGNGLVCGMSQNLIVLDFVFLLLFAALCMLQIIVAVGIIISFSGEMCYLSALTSSNITLKFCTITIFVTIGLHLILYIC